VRETPEVIVERIREFRRPSSARPTGRARSPRAAHRDRLARLGGQVVKKRRLDLTSALGCAGIGVHPDRQLLEAARCTPCSRPRRVIVFGGTFGAVLLSSSLTDVQRAWRSVSTVFYDDDRRPTRSSRP